VKSRGGRDNEGCEELKMRKWVLITGIISGSCQAVRVKGPSALALRAVTLATVDAEGPNI
jgi:hypothetical protein